jgi:hypothetical protein
MQDFTHNVISEHVSLQKPTLSSDNYLSTKVPRLFITSWYHGTLCGPNTQQLVHDTRGRKDIPRLQLKHLLV